MRQHIFLLRLLFVSIWFSDASWGHSVTLGSKDAVPGIIIEIPVNIEADQNLAGLHLRLVYDPLVFNSPLVEKGPLLSKNHLIDVFSPDNGQLNFIVHSLQGATAFSAQSGTVVKLRMRISEAAAAGSYLIGFATPSPGSIVLPPSGLATSEGIPVAHTLVPATIQIHAPLIGDLDGNMTLNNLDIFLFSSWWRKQPDVVNSPANLIQSAPNDIIDMRDLLQFIDSWQDSEVK